MRGGAGDVSWEIALTIGRGKFLRPRSERGHDAGVQRHTVRELLGAATQAVLAGQAHAIHSGSWRRCAARGGDVFGLAAKLLCAAEARGVHHLKKHGGAPPFLRIGATVTGESAGERLDEQRERVALVPVIDAAHREQRAGRTGGERGRIVGGLASGGERPRAGKFFALGVQALREAVGRDRHRDVEDHGLAVGGPSGGEWIGGEHFAAPAKRRDAAHVRIGAREDDHQAVVGRAFQIGGETADMMAAPNRDGAEAVLFRPRHREIERAEDHPRAGEAPRVPRNSGVTLHLFGVGALSLGSLG